MGARVAVAGASGYAGGELLRLLAGHPDLEIGPVTGQGNAGQPVGAVHPHLAALPGLAGRRFEALEESLLGECDLVFLALPHGQSAALAAGLPAGVDGGGPGRGLPAWRPGRLGRSSTAPSIRAGGPTGCPELPGAARRDQRRPPGRRARLLRHRGGPGPGPAAGGGPGQPRGRGRGGRVRHVRRGPVGQAGTARQRGHGLGVRLPGRWPAPAHPGDGAGPRRGRRDGGDRLVHPAAGPHAARHPGHLHRPADRALARRRPALRAALARRTRASRSCACCPRASGRPRRRSAARTPRTCRWPRTTRASRAVAVAALDNLGKGAAGQAIQDANLMLGLPETAGLAVCGVAP